MLNISVKAKIPPPHPFFFFSFFLFFKKKKKKIRKKAALSTDLCPTPCVVIYFAIVLCDTCYGCVQWKTKETLPEIVTANLVF